MWQIENEIENLGNTSQPKTSNGTPNEVEEELVELNLTDQAKSLSPMLPRAQNDIPNPNDESDDEDTYMR